MTVEQGPVEREATLGCSPERLWEALTDPESVSEWLGATVEWEMTPGGGIHTRDAEGNERGGVIDDVAPGRRLRFRWWPVGDEGQATEVTYVVEPLDAGAHLLVTERRAATARACRSSAGASRTTEARVQWSGWDSRLLLLWAAARRDLAVR